VARIKTINGFLHLRYTDLYSMSLDVVGAVGASGEVGEVELDLIPAAVEAHRQHAAERMDARRALIVARAETTTNVLVIKDLHQGGAVHMRRNSNII